jgi:hypothetical protein
VQYDRPDKSHFENRSRRDFRAARYQVEALRTEETALWRPAPSQARCSASARARGLTSVQPPMWCGADVVTAAVQQGGLRAVGFVLVPHDADHTTAAALALAAACRAARVPLVAGPWSRRELVALCRQAAETEVPGDGVARRVCVAAAAAGDVDAIGFAVSRSAAVVQNDVERTLRCRPPV